MSTTNPPAKATIDASSAGSDQGAANLNHRDITTADATPAAATNFTMNTFMYPPLSQADEFPDLPDQQILNFAQDSAEARNAKDKADLEAYQSRTRSPNWCTNNKRRDRRMPHFFVGPPAPTEELLLHLAPLKEYQSFCESYAYLAQTYNVSWTKIKSFEAKMKKFHFTELYAEKSETYAPNSYIPKRYTRRLDLCEAC
jgi:hypothetical protein